MWIIWTFFACSGAPQSDTLVSAGPLESFAPGMWEQRALTIQSGLQEALALAETGEEEQAQELIEAVYTGSFEPELEPVIRSHLGRHVALELEFEFSKMLKAIRSRRERGVQLEALLEQVGQAAAILESKAASLRQD